MMAISLDSFRQAAQVGGRVTLDQHRPGGLDAAGRGFGGRLVSWLRETFGGAAVQAENRETTRAFLGALRQQFGPSLGDMAAQRLAGDIERGRPLTARNITATLDELARSRQQTSALNTGFAVRFAEVDDATSPMSFGRVFDDISRAMGSGIRLDQVDPGRLADTRQAIARDIRAAGGDGARLVDGAEAHGNATREVKKLVVAETRSRLKAELTTPGDGSTGFDRAFARACEERGIDLPQESFNLRGLQKTLGTSLLSATYNRGEDAHTRPISREDAQALVERDIGQYLDGKKALLDKAAVLADGNEAHAALLRELVAGAEKMKPQELERMWQLRGEVDRVLRTILDPGQDLSTRLGSIRHLTTAIVQAQFDLRLDAEGVNRLMDTLVHTALATTDLSEADLATIRAALGHPDFAALRETLVMPMGEPELMPVLGDAGREMIGLASIINVLCDQLEIPSGEPQDIDSVGKVPTPVLEALRANGMDLPALMAGD